MGSAVPENIGDMQMMYCVNCENPVTYDDTAARKCPHCGNDPAHEAKAAVPVKAKGDASDA